MSVYAICKTRYLRHLNGGANNNLSWARGTVLGYWTNRKSQFAASPFDVALNSRRSGSCKVLA